MMYKNIYDLVADEYEERVNSLLPVTKEVVLHFTSAITTGKEILDVGCGVGLAINLLTHKNYSCTGIELSPKMITYAQKRTPLAKFIEGDFLETEFNQKFDGILMLAFIHLFPKVMAEKILEKTFNTLKSKGVLYAGTTESSTSSEGWEKKADYLNQTNRFRKHWTKDELKQSLIKTGFKINSFYTITDPYGKKWMDFLVSKS